MRPADNMPFVSNSNSIVLLYSPKLVCIIRHLTSSLQLSSTCSSGILPYFAVEIPDPSLRSTRFSCSGLSQVLVVPSSAGNFQLVACSSSLSILVNS